MDQERGTNWGASQCWAWIPAATLLIMWLCEQIRLLPCASVSSSAKRNHTSTCSVVLLRGLNEFIQVKYLEQCGPLSSTLWLLVVVNSMYIWKCSISVHTKWTSFFRVPPWWFIAYCFFQWFFALISPKCSFLRTSEWHAISYRLTMYLQRSLSVEGQEGRCSRQWFPMKLVSLVGAASSHNPSIPWASVSVYKEWFSNIKACEKTNRPKLRAL